jgi:hypothetical protein
VVVFNCFSETAKELQKQLLWSCMGATGSFSKGSWRVYTDIQKALEILIFDVTFEQLYHNSIKVDVNLWKLESIGQEVKIINQK